MFQIPRGVTDLVHASFLIFFAYVGVEDVVKIAEETQDPTTVIPRAIVLAILVTTTLYLMSDSPLSLSFSGTFSANRRHRWHSSPGLGSDLGRVSYCP